MIKMSKISMVAVTFTQENIGSASLLLPSVATQFNITDTRNIC